MISAMMINENDCFTVTWGTLNMGHVFVLLADTYIDKYGAVYEHLSP